MAFAVCKASEDTAAAAARWCVHWRGNYGSQSAAFRGPGCLVQEEGGNLLGPVLICPPLAYAPGCPGGPAVQPEEGRISTGCFISLQLNIVQSFVAKDNSWLQLTHT